MSGNVVPLLRPRISARAYSLAHEPRILDIIAAELEAAGLVGEARLAKLIYLVLTSRFMPRPLCGFVTGPSSAGKSTVVERVVKLFPPSAYHFLTGMTKKAIVY